MDHHSSLSVYGLLFQTDGFWDSAGQRPASSCFLGSFKELQCPLRKPRRSVPGFPATTKDTWHKEWQQEFALKTAEAEKYGVGQAHLAHNIHLDEAHLW
jgi:hypothetical protein